MNGESKRPRISIIVPALNEAQSIADALAALTPLRERGHEVIVVDGGSDDDTVALALARADRVVVAPRGRASQMNAGAQVAAGGVLLFLHADTRLPEHADRIILDRLDAMGRSWGRFDVHIDGNSRLLAVVGFFMNFRSRLTGIATGDQAIFVRRDLFRTIGGFPPIALMEDLAISRALKGRSAPLCLRERVVTSGRRWERHGVIRTIVKMWWLRLRYFFGEAPARLARGYDGIER